MRLTVRLIDQGLDRRNRGEVNAFLVDHEDVVPATIDGEPRLDADEAIRTGWVRLHFQSADYARTGKPARVQPELVDVVLLLLPEIALDEKFACEVVIAREGPDFTFGASLRLRVFDYHVPSRFELSQSGGWT